MKEKSLSSHQQAAQALRDARIHKKPITRISETYGIEGLEAAYAVAEINTSLELSAGKRISGKKSCTHLKSSSATIRRRST